jgi:putative transposase
MPRRARIDAPGALQHIICRGIQRCRIYRDDSDRQDFLNRLGQILRGTRTTCYAWALSLGDGLFLMLYFLNWFW